MAVIDIYYTKNLTLLLNQSESSLKPGEQKIAKWKKYKIADWIECNRWIFLCSYSIFL